MIRGIERVTCFRNGALVPVRSITHSMQNGLGVDRLICSITVVCHYSRAAGQSLMVYEAQHNTRVKTTLGVRDAGRCRALPHILDGSAGLSEISQEHEAGT